MLRLIAAILAWLTVAAAASAQPARPGAPAAPEPVTIIHAGTLLAVPGQPPRHNASIIIRGGRIAEVRDGFVDLPGARVVELRTSFVLPGLIDSHVHLIGLDDRLQSRLQAPFRDVEDEAFNGLLNARRTLLAGFTTVRDLGANDPRTILSLRDAINADQFAGPTILTAGSMISISGGHGDANGLNRDLTEAARRSDFAVCNGADDCRRATRQLVGMGVDVIKFAATGGVLSNVPGGLNQQMDDDEMRAIVETAHRFGRRVASHAHGVNGVNAALRAGVDSIEHGTFTDDESFRLYRSSHAWYVPTLMAPAAALADGERGLLTPAQYDKAREAAGHATQTLGRALREQVAIAFGTDSGVSRHGLNAQEFALMVRAGMTPMAAIRAATVGAATLLGREDRIGTIEPGKDADIVAVEGDPLTDVTILEHMRFVMRHGRVHLLAGERALSSVD